MAHDGAGRAKGISSGVLHEDRKSIAAKLEQQRAEIGRARLYFKLPRRTAPEQEDWSKVSKRSGGR